MTQINLRVDDDVKERAVQACKELGIPLATAINIYLVKLGNECRILRKTLPEVRRLSIPVPLMFF